MKPMPKYSNSEIMKRLETEYDYEMQHKLRFALKHNWSRGWISLFQTESEVLNALEYLGLINGSGFFSDQARKIGAYFAN